MRHGGAVIGLAGALALFWVWTAQSGPVSALWAFVVALGCLAVPGRLGRPRLRAVPPRRRAAWLAYDTVTFVAFMIIMLSWPADHGGAVIAAIIGGGVAAGVGAIWSPSPRRA